MKKKSFLIGGLALVLALGFIGCGGNETSTPKQNTVNVSGIPSGTSILGASLMDPSAPSTPVAIAANTSNESGKAVFKFFQTLSGQNLPDPTKPFRANGNYSLGLADSSNTYYMYDGYVQFSSSKKTLNLLWSDFKGGDTVESTTITINNRPSNAVAVLISDPVSGDRIAVGIFLTPSSDSCLLFEPGSSFGQDLDKPWKGSGSYAIKLISATEALVATYKGYYTFTGEATEEFDYNTDFTTDEVTPFEGNTLVIDIPTGTTIIAVIITDEDDDFIAVGMMNTDGVFELYEVDDVVGGVPMPSSSPWTGTGPFGIILATGMDVTDPVYVYTGNGGEFDFDEGENTADWSDFDLFEPIDFEECTMLTIADLLETEDIFAALLMDGSNPDPIAVAVNVEGIFYFFESDLTDPAMPMPDFDKPWKGIGDFDIVLVDSTGEPVKTCLAVSFDEEDEIELDWTDFDDV